MEDYIGTGAAAWNAVQPSNNIGELPDKYGDVFCFEGGFDTTGKASRPDATPEEIEAEVERCFREYGGKKGYVFAGGFPASAGATNTAARNAALVGTANRLRFAKV